MPAWGWYVVAGGLLLLMALSYTTIRRLPVTTAMIYLAVGYALGPSGFGVLAADVVAGAAFWERLTELVVILSLFTAGVKLAGPTLGEPWRPAIRLATLSMALSVALTAAIGLALGMSLGVAVLLGAILAPTDPVLAGDVQVKDREDRDRLRMSLTGEAGLNDGTAFPFMLLGLALLKDPARWRWGLSWLAIDVVWAIGMGILVGAVMGYATGQLVVRRLARRRRELPMQEFLTLGLVASAYGVALALHAYGFLAVFAAGVALRDVERRARSEKAEVARKVSHDVQSFNEQMERLGEVLVLLLVGASFAAHVPTAGGLALVVALMLVVRPVSVWLGLAGLRLPVREKLLISWFGVRGIGSLYYLTHAVGRGLPAGTADVLASVCLTALGVSALLHGMTGMRFVHGTGRGCGAGEAAQPRDELRKRAAGSTPG